MEPGKKGRLLDQFERFLLTVLYVWLVYRVINAIDRADFTKVFVVQLPALLSEGLLLVFIWIRRSPTEITNSGLSWLIAFGVINAYNPFVRSLYQAVNAVTEPLLRPIRRAMPDLGAVDISPVVLLLGCFFIQSVVLPNIAKLAR